MDAIYFQPNEESAVHLHAGYATGVFFPSLNVIVYDVQHGSFGGNSCSLSESKELIDELRAALEGKAAGQATKYSRIAHFNIEDNVVQDLLKDIKEKNQLEVKVQGSLDQLFTKAQPDKGQTGPPKVDPTTLDAATKMRLEALVEQCQHISVKAEFYRALGNAGKADQYRDALCDDLIKGFVECPSSHSLQHTLEEFKRLGIEQWKGEELAKRAYEIGQEKDDIGLQLTAGRMLKLPESAMRGAKEKLLYETMMRGTLLDLESYLDVVKQDAEGLQSDRVKGLARKAYGKMMRLDAYDLGATYLCAGVLAKQFGLGRGKVLEAGKEFIKNYSQLVHSEEFDLQVLQRAVQALELPDIMVQPLMVAYFKKSIEDGADQDHLEIAKKFRPSDTEIRTLVEQRYRKGIKNGNFSDACKLRERYPGLIKDDVSLDDLRIISGIEKIIYLRSSGEHLE